MAMPMKPELTAAAHREIISGWSRQFIFTTRGLRDVAVR
jgi:hypothetical protein